MAKLKETSALIYSPFLVAATLFVLTILSRSTGFGPSNNLYAVCALAAIPLGIIVGVIFLFLAKSMRIRWRLLVGLLYLPTAVFSLLMAGF